MSWWIFGPRRRVIAALASDDRPIRHLYTFDAGVTVADLRDRLAEPGDHDRLVWPDFDSYRGYVLTALRRDRRKHRVWLDDAEAWRFPSLSRFTVVLRPDVVEFWPDEWQGTPSRAGPPYLVAA
ncbi:hypothetical protein HJG53_09965 [Sphingomonas sp. ID1715]|uniref:hypothetical protein n=1 Tax=Sphingomonas sp. ID1715 TaxID=1656898 RepID=UPI0014889ED1|nr:hypothetical protein [Sphingomonas sp. ID1715]NNM77228.1 hypothetical protein [Sphingomonas sp. ID1715]